MSNTQPMNIPVSNAKRTTSLNGIRKDKSSIIIQSQYSYWHNE